MCVRRMVPDSPQKNRQSKRSRRRTLLGTTIIVVALIVAGLVGALVVAKGVESAWSAIFGGSTFIVILVLYWHRVVKDGALREDHHG